jgi:hypothetical protein
MSRRARVTVAEPRSLSGCSSRRIKGGRSGRKLSILRSRVRSDMERNVHAKPRLFNGHAMLLFDPR